MKILFTADYHISLSKKNVPVEWAVNRYRSLFSQVVEVDCDIHVIGGDIFDRTPSLAELNIFFDLVLASTKPTYIFDGNHCATKKGATFLGLLNNLVTKMNPLVHIVTEVKEFPWGTIVPYCCLRNKGVFTKLNTSKPIFTHVRGAIPPHVTPEIDLKLLEPFSIVFAGDLHSHSNSQLNIVYPGAPITTCFHRNLVDTGYLLIDGIDWEWHSFKVPQLIRKTISKKEEMVKTEYHHTIYEIEGSISDLSGVKNSELLDKKIIKRSNEVSLALTKEMTIEDELTEFLLYILELPEKEVEEIVGVFHDNV